MPKENKCASKQQCDPSTSSDSSEACYKVKCESKCEKNDCCIPECDCYRPEELACRFKDAVVEIHSEFILIGASGPTGLVRGFDPLAFNSRTDVILEGNGFFIKGHYIIAPAQLVLLPPPVTAVANRFPFSDASNVLGVTGATGTTILNEMVRASRILVSVFNVNGKGNSFVYEADLVGVDGAGDIAVLRINNKKQWNLCNPPVLKCHPHLEFASSRAAKDGEKVYLIGDLIANASNNGMNSVGLISKGLLADHRYLDYAGFGLAEWIVASAPAFAKTVGVPILNCQGKVLGMQTSTLRGIDYQLPVIDEFDINTSTNVNERLQILSDTRSVSFVAGPSEFFMKRVIKKIIQGACTRKWDCNLEVICDPAGTFLRYKKAYAGIAYEVFTGIDYDITVDYTSGTAFSGEPRVRLSANGDFLNSPACKELIGLKVVGIAGLNPNDFGFTGPTGPTGETGPTGPTGPIAGGAFFVPGGAAFPPFPAFLPVSPLIQKLQPGDVITHIDGIALGDLHKQIVSSLITWRLCAEDQIEICYRKGGNANNAGDNGFTDNYDNLFTYNICLLDFPKLLDYPYYAINNFPSLADNFVFNNNQIGNPLLPQVIGGGLFRPSF